MRFQPRHLPSRKAMGSRGIHVSFEAADPAGGRSAHCFGGMSFPEPLSSSKTAAAMYTRRRGERGSAILESFLAMILLGMILFGILQLFQLALADMVADYAAFRGARSAAVGFRDEYAIREALIKSAPASGPMVTPDRGSYTNWGAVETEKSLLRGFMEGDRHVEYADWVGEERFHTNYHCPHYGELLIGGCSVCRPSRNHYVRASAQGFDQTMHFQFEFVHYPLNIPLHDWLTGRDSIDISSETELTNHSAAFLE